MTSEQIHNGDTAEYIGSHEPLSGKRCTVDSWSLKRKRVRVIIDVGGRAALRSVKPDNLRRLGGGYWRTVMSAECGVQNGADSPEDIERDMLYGPDVEPELCPHCGKDLYDFSDLGCGHCDARHPAYPKAEG